MCVCVLILLPSRVLYATTHHLPPLYHHSTCFSSLQGPAACIRPAAAVQGAPPGQVDMLHRGPTAGAVCHPPQQGWEGGGQGLPMAGWIRCRWVGRRPAWWLAARGWAIGGWCGWSACGRRNRLLRTVPALRMQVARRQRRPGETFRGQEPKNPRLFTFPSSCSVPHVCSCAAAGAAKAAPCCRLHFSLAGVVVPRVCNTR